jgi:hypothetical protein
MLPHRSPTIERELLAYRQRCSRLPRSALTLLQQPRYLRRPQQTTLPLLHWLMHSTPSPMRT